MGNEQSAPSRSLSRASSVASASASSSRRNSAQGANAAPTSRFTVRDESATTEEPPPPPYTPRTRQPPSREPVPMRARHGHYLTVTPDTLHAQLSHLALPPGQDLRRSSSSATPRPASTDSASRAGHRRTASLADPAARRDARAVRPDARAEAARVDLEAIQADLVFLQHALMHAPSPHPRLSRTPSPRLHSALPATTDFLDPLGALARRPRPASSQSQQRSTPAAAIARTPSPSSVSTPSSATAPSRVTKEDPLVLLRKYDTIVIVDDSDSMLGERWQEARDALVGVVDAVSRYDLSGIQLHFLNDPYTCTVKNPSDIEKAFCTVDPNGSTPIGEKLEQLLLDYMQRLESSRQSPLSGSAPTVKPVNFVVLTDGAPSDDPESVIVAAARRLDAGHFPVSQVGIQFVQIGDDPEATAALQELDDELARTHGVRDIVDTTPYRGTVTAETVAKILLGGINRRVDKRGL